MTGAAYTAVLMTKPMTASGQNRGQNPSEGNCPRLGGLFLNKKNLPSFMLADRPFFQLTGYSANRFAYRRAVD